MTIANNELEIIK